MVEYLKGISLWSLLVFSWFAIGCVSSGSKNGDTSSDEVAASGGAVEVYKPTEIYLLDFYTNSGEWKVAESGGALRALQINLQQMVTSGLNAELSYRFKRVKPVLSVSQVPEGNHWVISGEFIQVSGGEEQGVQVRVYVYDAYTNMDKPVLSFSYDVAKGDGKAKRSIVAHEAVNQVASVAKSYTREADLLCGLLGDELDSYWKSKGWK